MCVASLIESTCLNNLICLSVLEMFVVFVPALMIRSNHNYYPAACAAGLDRALTAMQHNSRSILGSRSDLMRISPSGIPFGTM